MKYLLNIYYKTPVMEKVTEAMGQMFDDWGKDKNELVAKESFEFETDEPLTKEAIAKIEEMKGEWMEKFDNVKVEVEQAND